MPAHTLASLPLLVPAGFVLLALALRFGLERLKQPRWAILVAAFLPTLLAAASVGLLALSGPGDSPTWGIGDVGLTARLDALSVTLLLLVSFLGAVVLGFSTHYLDGDAQHAKFLAQLCLTLAAVTLLVIAGNLYHLLAAWVAMSLCLHGLLVFRPERPGALLAARKKFALARTGDFALLVAAALIVAQTGTANLNELSSLISQGGVGSLSLAPAAGLIALAAVLKSAQFPTHGWLVEVMETPTPVSALLHAGIVNAGGFLLLRFADLMLSFPAIMLAVAMLGALTAVFGSVVMLTQTSQKGSLAYSTVAQMGFMMFQCGLGAFPAAALHLVGHSLYKAYAFLSSGEAVVKVRYHRPPLTGGLTVPAALARLSLLALLGALYWVIGSAFGTTWQTQPVVFTLGSVFLFSVWLFIATGFGAKDWTPVLAVRVTAGALFASAAYFALQAGAARLLAAALPVAQAPGVAGRILLALVFAVFLAIALLQVFPSSRLSLAAHALRVHAANGFYVNLLINRVLGAYRFQGVRNV
jgi:NAD(P)H-quinone oxidoreductase subunit 5